jgi:hypothetical protein
LDKKFETYYGLSRLCEGYIICVGDKPAEPLGIIADRCYLKNMEVHCFGSEDPYKCIEEPGMFVFSYKGKGRGLVVIFAENLGEAMSKAKIRWTFVGVCSIGSSVWVKRI